MFRVAILLIAFHSMCSFASAQVITLIDFEGGIVGNPVATTYSSLGLTFNNAMFASPPTGFGSPSNQVALTNILPDPNFPDAANPIVGTFFSTVSRVAITAQDVGQYGARIDVYDAVVGGTLLGRSDVVGPTVGGGAGTFFDLGVSAAGIRRFELYQHMQPLGPPNRADGVKWDNLEFHSVPEPNALILSSMAVFSSLVRLVRRHVSHSCSQFNT